MPSLWRQTDLPELVAALGARPGHETVRTLLADILRHGFGAARHLKRYAAEFDFRYNTRVASASTTASAPRGP